MKKLISVAVVALMVATTICQAGEEKDRLKAENAALKAQLASLQGQQQLVRPRVKLVQALESAQPDTIIGQPLPSELPAEQAEVQQTPTTAIAPAESRIDGQRIVSGKRPQAYADVSGGKSVAIALGPQNIGGKKHKDKDRDPDSVLKWEDNDDVPNWAQRAQGGGGIVSVGNRAGVINNFNITVKGHGSVTVAAGKTAKARSGSLPVKGEDDGDPRAAGYCPPRRAIALHRVPPYQYWHALKTIEGNTLRGMTQASNDYQGGGGTYQAGETLAPY